VRADDRHVKPAMASPGFWTDEKTGDAMARFTLTDA